MTKTLLVISGVAGLLAASQATAAPTCGATVYADVLLTADLVCPAGSDGIVIGADNLRVDLNGYSITTPTYAFASTGIRSVGFKGIKVTGPGRIDNFTSGIVLNGGALHEVRGVATTGPGVASIVMENTTDSIVDGNDVTFISIRSNPGSLSSRNRVSANVAKTVWVQGCGTTGTEVGDNQLSGSSLEIAVQLDGGGGAWVHGNRISPGIIWINGSSQNVVEANTITNATSTTGRYGYTNVLMDSRASACGGSRASPGASYNKIRSNGLFGGIWGVRFFSGASRNEVTDNKIYGASTSGLSFDAGADDNDARGNAIYNTPTIAIDQGRGNLWP